MGTQLPLKGTQPPIFGPCLLWPNARPSHLLLRSFKFLNVFKFVRNSSVSKFEIHKIRTVDRWPTVARCRLSVFSSTKWAAERRAERFSARQYGQVGHTTHVKSAWITERLQVAFHIAIRPNG